MFPLPFVPPQETLTHPIREINECTLRAWNSTFGRASVLKVSDSLKGVLSHLQQCVEKDALRMPQLAPQGSQDMLRAPLHPHAAAGCAEAPQPASFLELDTDSDDDDGAEDTNLNITKRSARAAAGKAASASGSVGGLLPEAISNAAAVNSDEAASLTRASAPSSLSSSLASSTMPASQDSMDSEAAAAAVQAAAARRALAEAASAEASQKADLRRDAINAATVAAMNAARAAKMAAKEAARQAVVNGRAAARAKREADLRAKEHSATDEAAGSKTGVHGTTAEELAKRRAAVEALKAKARATAEAAKLAAQQADAEAQAARERAIAEESEAMKAAIVAELVARQASLEVEADEIQLLTQAAPEVNADEAVEKPAVSLVRTRSKQHDRATPADEQLLQRTLSESRPQQCQAEGEEHTSTSAHEARDQGKVKRRGRPSAGQRKLSPSALTEQQRGALEAETERHEEAKRLEAELEAKRMAQEAKDRLAAEELEANRMVKEAKRLAEEANAKRLAEEAKAKRLAEEAKAKLLAEAARLQAKEAEAKQRAADAEAKRLAEEAEVNRRAEEKAKAEAKQRAEAAEAAEARRLAEEKQAKAKRLADKAAAKRRAQESIKAKRLAQEQATAKRLAEGEAKAKQLAEDAATAKRIAAEAEAAEAREELRQHGVAVQKEKRRLQAEAKMRRQAASDERRRTATEERRRLAQKPREPSAQRLTAGGRQKAAAAAARTETSRVSVGGRAVEEEQSLVESTHAASGQGTTGPRPERGEMSTHAPIAERPLVQRADKVVPAFKRSVRARTSLEEEDTSRARQASIGTPGDDDLDVPLAPAEKGSPPSKRRVGAGVTACVLTQPEAAVAHLPLSPTTLERNRQRAATDQVAASVGSSQQASPEPAATAMDTTVSTQSQAEMEEILMRTLPNSPGSRSRRGRSFLGRVGVGLGGTRPNARRLPLSRSSATSQHDSAASSHAASSRTALVHVPRSPEKARRVAVLTERQAERRAEQRAEARASLMYGELDRRVSLSSFEAPTPPESEAGADETVDSPHSSSGNQQPAASASDAQPSPNKGSTATSAADGGPAVAAAASAARHTKQAASSLSPDSPTKSTSPLGSSAGASPGSPVSILKRWSPQRHQAGRVARSALRRVYFDLESNTSHILPREEVDDAADAYGPFGASRARPGRGRVAFASASARQQARRRRLAEVRAAAVAVATVALNGSGDSDGTTATRSPLLFTPRGLSTSPPRRGGAAAASAAADGAAGGDGDHGSNSPVVAQHAAANTAATAAATATATTAATTTAAGAPAASRLASTAGPLQAKQALQRSPPTKASALAAASRVAAAASLAAASPAARKEEEADVAAWRDREPVKRSLSLAMAEADPVPPATQRRDGAAAVAVNGGQPRLGSSRARRMVAHGAARRVGSALARHTSDVLVSSSLARVGSGKRSQSAPQSLELLLQSVPIPPKQARLGDKDADLDAGQTREEQLNKSSAYMPDATPASTRVLLGVGRAASQSSSALLTPSSALTANAGATPLRADRSGIFDAVAAPALGPKT